MATDTIQIPATLAPNMLQIATDTISNFSPLVYTIIGILLAVVIVEILISIFRK